VIALREPDPRRTFGDAGERAAEAWLAERGMVAVARGFRSRRGEIDLIVEDRDVLVFVEVKTRAGSGYGRPAEAVGREKQRRMARVAEAFLAATGGWDRPCRFDVVEVEPVGGGKWRIAHIPDAFRLWPTG
jgi:putative endonuclease